MTLAQYERHESSSARHRDDEYHSVHHTQLIAATAWLIASGPGEKRTWTLRGTRRGLGEKRTQTTRLRQHWGEKRTLV